MAQRYAFFSDRSIYLHSSPAFCAADTMLMLLRILATSVTRKTPPLKSIEIISLLRNDGYFSGTEDQYYLAQSPRHETPQTWPRWMLFIMGTLPAAIKLGSFTELPWTKTWGMMFLSSFVTNELVALNVGKGHGDTTIAELLGSETADWQNAPQDSLRDKMFRLFRLNRMLLALETYTLNVVWFAHIILLIHAAQQVWAVASEYCINSPSSQYIILILCAATTALSAIGQICDYYFRYKGLFKWMLNENTNQSLIGRILTPALFIVSLLPKPSLWNVGERGMRIWGYITIFMYAVYARGYFMVGIDWLCGRFPRVARGLRIDGQNTIGWLDIKAFNCLCFFVANLGTSVLWYAYKYNPEGTMNPDWTDVFG